MLVDHFFQAGANLPALIFIFNADPGLLIFLLLIELFDQQIAFPVPMRPVALLKPIKSSRLASVFFALQTFECQLAIGFIVTFFLMVIQVQQADAVGLLIGRVITVAKIV